MRPDPLSRLFLLILLLTGLIVESLPARNPVQAGTSSSLSGVITDAITGSPVAGAKVTALNTTTRSVAGGLYTLTLDTSGTFPVTVTKPGYVQFTATSVVFQQGGTVTMDITLWESLNPPAGATAFLDTALQTVYLNWQVPRGNYELLYDDGSPENIAIWAYQGNLNAVRFTPVGYPVSVKGGSIHIGDSGNYTTGANPFVPFQVAVYNAAGSGGMPGTLIGGPFDVIPDRFGWNDFTFPAPAEVSSGEFYLVMIQGGNAPNAAGLAVDLSGTQLRSVARFITGGAPWMPAGGNFLIRAQLVGPGGPVSSDNLTESLIAYQIWRLKQGEEQNPMVWVDLGTTTDLFLSDQSWFSLPCGPYRWAVKAGYSGNRWSPGRFSNILGKCWTAAITVDVDLSCAEADKSGAFVCLKNMVYPDTIYTATVDTSGSHTFPAVWKGTYEHTVTKFGYQNYGNVLPITSNNTLQVLLLQQKHPPSNLQVDPKTLMAQWQAPVYRDTLFTETWSSGSFTTQGWCIAGGYNWVISSASGNPAPSAMFSWSPQVTAYDQTLTGTTINGVHSPELTFTYDILLDNFGTTTLNQMAVEVWDGSSWELLKTYSNAGGDFPWTREQIDLSGVTDVGFRIRFRAYGENSYDINAWKIDNVVITAAETTAGLLNCILGYNVYLNNVLSGFTTDTKYLIPGTLVQYGQSYETCVLAAYGSGHSPKTCSAFTSTFLFPPEELTATPVENTVYLTWLKPKIPDSTTPPGLTGYRIFRNGSMLTSIGHPDTLYYYDMDLEPGNYQYEVSAWYDLTGYGFPGQFDESMAAGPVGVQLSYGRELPFFEPWDQASFAYNEWQFEPDQGNWGMELNEGQPLPSARFNGLPPVADYAARLISPVLDASPYHCASIWLTFDLKLGDLAGTATESLLIEVFYNNSWHTMTLFQNAGSFGWQEETIDITAVAGQACRIRFTAKGGNSSNISGWYLDNIRVCAVCFPARNLTGEAAGFDVLLSWSPPQCNGTGGLLDEGFEGTEFPPQGWDRIITNNNATWKQIPASSSIGVHSGNFAAGLLWDYNHQDEWLIARGILVTGNITYWSYAYQGSVHADHYYVKVSPDGGAYWDILSDMSAMPLYPAPSGYNQWDTPYEIDMTPYLGQTVDIAWHAIDGDGQGLWYSWAIDDCLMATDHDQILGYDIYRSTGGTAGFIKINPDPVPDTTYTDNGLPPDAYHYFVQALFSECQQTETSDTIPVDVITSAATVTSGEPWQVYPNPSTGRLLIRSDSGILAWKLTSVTGVILASGTCNGEPLITLSLEHLPPGFVLLFLQTTEGIFSTKVILQR